MQMQKQLIEIHFKGTRMYEIDVVQINNNKKSI